ncbi:unnamed protein product [Bursaphelenchus okinawaensis]|uniref:MATH domain-containing protein n=1 Tax=Bursaphelenchus okinawaensis TaxID=465554 RepID=A0A811L8E2_9BILA|nr:unnamed protein product [Bursaphelenchus okinawaensis]CAG9117791.1 unnamed protein product [Bursaphelenchus okinawaensis]
MIEPTTAQSRGKTASNNEASEERTKTSSSNRPKTKQSNGDSAENGNNEKTKTTKSAGRKKDADEGTDKKNENRNSKSESTEAAKPVADDAATDNNGKEQPSKEGDGKMQKLRDRVNDGKKIEAHTGLKKNRDNEEHELVIDKTKCRFYLFGCDLEGNDHESKRPVKHLTSLNDSVIDRFRLINKVLDDDDKISKMYTAQKISTNSILCRESVQLVWPIYNMKEVLAKAKDKSGEVLVSEIFKSECFGYNMRAILMLYGRDHAEGKFVSFYVQLIPGPYDPILKWPFQETITLILYDRNEVATNRMDYRFELNPANEVVDDTYVGRPSAEKPNGWLGTDNFVDIDNIIKEGDYVVDDTAYFGVCIG